MERRTFIQNTAIVTSGALLLNSCSTDKSDQQKMSNSNKFSDDFELNEITISELQDKMKDGTYTSESITQLYLIRIEKIDKKGPALNSVIELNPDALSIAKAMDEERKAGKIRGPLHGIPVLIKDNIDTADKMMTTAGSLALVGHVAAQDAFIVSKLREAGAVLLGKTNLTEWANFRSSRACSGWSSRGGQTKNPYILDHNPCGSSSGSGVAVAANLCVVAVGTETDGSVTCPASVNGTVGIKPTVGLISRSGIIPISHTQDTAGPLARTVIDAAILLTAMTGIDTLDEITRESEGHMAIDYTSNLDANGLNGKRLGFEKKKYENQFLNRLLQQAIDLLKSQGAEIVELEYLDKLHELGDSEFEILKYEFKYGINKYLSTANTSMKSLKDLIEYNKQHEDQVMPSFKQENFEVSEATSNLKDKTYVEAIERSHLGAQRIIDQTIKENNLDALIGLTMGPACSIDTIYGDRWGDVFLTSPAAMSGYPHITVPAGKVYDLPVGLSFFAGAYREKELIRLAYAYEQAGKHRIKPEFKKAFLG